MTTSPAATVVQSFGGVTKASVAAKVHRTTVSKWVRRGNVPPANWPNLLLAAKRKKIKLTVFDLMATPKKKKASRK